MLGDLDDLLDNAVSLGGAVFGGKIGSDLGGSIANNLSDGDKTITALGNITGGLLGASISLDFVEGIFKDDES